MDETTQYGTQEAGRYSQRAMSNDDTVQEKNSAELREVAASEVEELTPREQKRIFHKIDRRLLIINGAMCAVSFLDRANMSNANIAG